MQRHEAAAEYKWDFSYLYPDIESWKKDLALLGTEALAYKKFKSKLKDEKVFLKYLDFDQELTFRVNKLAIYLHHGDVDTTNQLYQELEGLLVNEYQKIKVNTAFIAPELKKIGSEKIKEWLVKNPSYLKYDYGFRRFFEEAEHILSDHDEALLSQVSRSRGHTAGIYDVLAFADREDPIIEYQNEKQPLTTSLLMKIMEDSKPIEDQQLRIEANQLYSKLFRERKHSFASIYEGILISEVESMKLRHYSSTLSASLKDDAVPEAIYLKLLEVGKNNSHLFKNYHQFLKKHFQLKEFYATDRQLKVVADYNREFDVDGAKTLIKNALGLLGEEYSKKLEKAWLPNRIDYYEATNKRSGAYSTGGNGFDPIILMNWDNKLNSVNTLAHESGHSVHTLFADEYQPYPLNEYPIILAEVASTINEHLLFDYLYQNSTDLKEKIYLLQQRIFELLSTFTRQIQFAAFEYEAHRLVEVGQPLTADILGQLFKKIQNEYGYDIFDPMAPDELPYSWPRISHFYHSSFYVYKYALDIVASYKLYTDLKAGNVETTLNFLKSGGHKEPLEIMKDAGVDFTKTETYEPLLKGIQDNIVELGELTEKLHKEEQADETTTENVTVG